MAVGEGKSKAKPQVLVDAYIRLSSGPAPYLLDFKVDCRDGEAAWAVKELTKSIIHQKGKSTERIIETYDRRTQPG
jgi:hypothetical protein